jgi:glycosyltransferase involved in cell wall biosynthesis
VRLAVYTDYLYGRADGRLFAQRAFVLFLGELAKSFERVIVPGRLDPDLGSSHYAVSPKIEFVPLPYYRSVDRPLEAIGAMLRSLRVFWRMLDDVDAVWLLGPHPLCVAFALLAALRRKRVVLGVRQNTPRYARVRHPGRRRLHLVADALDAVYRAMARRFRTVVVGPELAERYSGACDLLEISVSLVREQDLVSAEEAATRAYDGELRALSVGRLETEKNPLLLADILARLIAADPRWRLVVCGEGNLEQELRARLEALGVADHAELVGYMPWDGGLLDLYRDSHALLHVSWTEGVPQVLFEAFASGLPVVATAVGGVEGAVGSDALLIPPGDAPAASDALQRVASDPGLRRRLAAGGLGRVRDRTLELEARRVAEFISQPFRSRADVGRPDPPLPNRPSERP